MKAMPFAPKLDNLLVARLDETHLIYKGPASLSVLMPVGDSDDLETIQASTVGLTFIGMIVLLIELYNKSTQKVSEYSDFSLSKKEIPANKKFE